MRSKLEYIYISDSTWTGMGDLHKGFQRTRFVVTYCIQKWLTLMKKETRYEAHLWHTKEC